jgi:hypothetical protein
MDTNCNIFETKDKNVFSIWFKGVMIEATQEDINRLYAMLTFHQTVINPLKEVKHRDR